MHIGLPTTSVYVNTMLTYNRYIGASSLSSCFINFSLLLQDHKVFARHDKFGMLEVPKEFLNTNKQAPAAVKKAVRQACRAYITKDREDSCTINYVDGDALTHRAPRLVQASNAHGWHGARNKARANEEQKQQQQQKQKKKQQQQQRRQQQRRQQQTSGAGKKTRISSLSVDGVEARIS